MLTLKTSNNTTFTCGGQNSLHKSDHDNNEPNGSHYERKGMTGNIFYCLDCGLQSFQTAIENHVCPAWPELKARPKQTELVHDDNLENGPDHKSKVAQGSRR